MQLIAVLGAGKDSSRLADLHAGLDAESQLTDIFVELIDPEPASHIVEVDVAGDLERMYDVGWAMGSHAARLVIGIVSVGAGTVDGIRSGQDMLCTRA